MAKTIRSNIPNKVILKPVKVSNWAGVHKYPNCYDNLAPYLLRSGGRYTGVGEEEEIELKKLPEYSGVDLSQNSNFWDNFFVRIDGPIVLQPNDSASDLLNYYFLRSHVEVKTSELEHKASAKYVLVDEEEEAKKFNKKAETKLEAMMELSTMTLSDKQAALRVLGTNADSLTPEIVNKTIFELVDKNPDKFLTIWVKNGHRETEVLISRAISEGIIHKKNTSYFHGDVRTGTCIGNSAEQAISFLEDKNNQDVVIAINKQLKVKVR